MNILGELDLSRKSLQGFGRVMFFCLLGLGFVLFLKHKPVHETFYALALFFLLASLFVPIVLKPLYIVLMCIGFCLGKVNTYILLCVFFYLIITPIGMLLRLFGKSFLGLKVIKGDANSYWIKRESINFKKDNYERSF